MKKQFLLPGIAIILLLGIAFIAVSNQGQNSGNETISQEKGSSQYITYSESNLAKAQKSGRAVLYFWASWCPTCKVLDAELKERGNELPSDVTILQVNYDTEDELKKRYGITQQHTLVQIDKDGNEIQKWIGGGIETIKQQLK